MNNWVLYILVGFIAQMISGSLGMAYGITGTLFLLTLGVPSSLASASIHMATVVTSLASGISHLVAGNIDKDLFLRLLIPGILGGLTGSLLLTNFNADIFRPYIYAYLFLMGLRILIIALRDVKIKRTKLGYKIYPIGVAAGILDALGGGGWGPIITSTLVASGVEPRKTVGTVDSSKFFVALSQVITFSVFLSISNWQVILGLIIGGVTAAPIAAYVCKRIQPKKLMVLVGILISSISLVSIMGFFK